MYEEPERCEGHFLSAIPDKWLSRLGWSISHDREHFSSPGWAVFVGALWEEAYCRGQDRGHPSRPA